MSRLHGVIVTYQREGQLADYFAHLRAQSRSLDTLTVVDSDPAGSAAEVVRSHGLEHTEVCYYVAPENVGPAGGIATGMERILTHAADDDWLLTLDDDDPPVEPGDIEELVRFGEELTRLRVAVGGVGVVGVRFDERLGRLVNVADVELDGAVAVSSISGGHLPCYRVGVVRSVGVFNRDLFYGFEELEYGLRVIDSGHGLFAHGDLWLRERIRHGRLDRELTRSRRLEDPGWRRYYSTRNLVFVLRVRGLHRQAATLALVQLAKPIANLVRSPQRAWAHLRLNTRAVSDAYCGRMGRRMDPGRAGSRLG